MPHTRKTPSLLQVVLDQADESVSPRAGNGWVVPAAAGNIGRSISVYANLAHKPALLADGGAEKNNIQVVVAGIEHGLPVKAFEKLKDFLGVSRKALTEIVHISERTLSRRRTLKTDESERIFRLGAVFQRGIEVLGSREEAQRWFTSAQKALGGVSPLSFCKTDPGAREVEDLLGRIEHGVLA